MLLVLIPVSGIASLFFLRRGTAARSEGVPSVARVERTGDGSCVLGARREHCFRLELQVLPEGESPFAATLDVLVPDRFSTRVQAGSYVWVVRSREAPREVALALEAFSEPPPSPPVAP